MALHLESQESVLDTIKFHPPLYVSNLWNIHPSIPRKVTVSYPEVTGFIIRGDAAIGHDSLPIQKPSADAGSTTSMIWIFSLFGDRVYPGSRELGGMHIERGISNWL